MEDERITLAVFWIALMLTFLLGDVLRIFAGHATPGKIGDMELGQAGWLAIGLLMFTPILMVMLSVVIPYPAIRWIHIVFSIFWILFNLLGVAGYEGWYDTVLIVISICINIAIVWIAWNWVPSG